MPRIPENLTGQTFHDLTVVKITERRNSYGRLLYECLCSCGNIVYATAANLKRDEIKRCCICKSKKHIKDLTGKRFGKLVVLSCVGKNNSVSIRAHRWECLCDCGNKTLVYSSGLLSGNTTSCGCSQVEKVKALYAGGTAVCKLKESNRSRATNTSGITGVWYDKTRKMWSAEIMLRGKKYYLGRYGTKEEAAAARKKAEERLFLPIIEKQTEER